MTDRLTYEQLTRMVTSRDGVPLRFSDGSHGENMDDAESSENRAVPATPHEGFREIWKELIKEAVREVLDERL